MANPNKEKGSRFEREVATRTGGRRSPLSGAVGGGDIWGGIFANLALVPECKVSKRMSWTTIRGALEQAKSEAEKKSAGWSPVAVFKEDRGDTYCAFYLEDFLALVQALDGPEGGFAYRCKNRFRTIRKFLDEIEDDLRRA